MAKSFDGSENYTTGAVVITDSQEIPNFVTDIAQGLNGSIGFIFKSYERQIVVEFRSQTSLNNFLSSVASNNAEIQYDSQTYLVKNISLVEHFDSKLPVWTYSITLYRDGNV